MKKQIKLNQRLHQKRLQVNCVFNRFILNLITLTMGNTQNTHQNVTPTEEAPKINHQKFTNRQIIKKSPEEQLILIKLSVPHQKEYNTWAEQLTKTDSHQSLLLPKTHQFKKEGFCGLSGVVEITFQNYPFLLNDQINNRYCMGSKYFEQSELWYLVLTLLSAAHLFHGQNKKVGDIRPENVFISEDGSVKVACLLSWPTERTNYQKSFEKQTTYIAPQQTDDLRFGKLDPSSDFKLAQTFSIGLTLLDAATLSDSRDIYKSQSSIDFDILSLRLKDLNLKEQYSPLLRALISNICEINHKDRTSCEELYEWISPYEEEINNFETFEPANVPQKIMYEVNSKSQIQQAQPPISSSQFNPTYVSNTYVATSSYSSKNNVSFQQPSSFQTQILSSYQQQNPPLVVASTYVPTYDFTTQPVRKTYQLPSSISGQATIGSNYGTVESSYMGLGGRFSLQKIDEQLQQSRKMFPS